MVASHLDGHGQCADALVDRWPILAERLCTEHATVRFAEDQFQTDHRGAGVIAGMRVRENVDLLEVLVAELVERFLADAGPGRGAAKQADDRSPLRAAIAGIPSGDHVSSDAALTVCRTGQRHEAPLSGREVLDFDGIADGEDVRVARAHVLVDADAPALADF